MCCEKKESIKGEDQTTVFIPPSLTAFNELTLGVQFQQRYLGGPRKVVYCLWGVGRLVRFWMVNWVVRTITRTGSFPRMWKTVYLTGSSGNVWLRSTVTAKGVFPIGTPKARVSRVKNVSVSAYPALSSLQLAPHKSPWSGPSATEVISNYWS